MTIPAMSPPLRPLLLPSASTTTLTALEMGERLPASSSALTASRTVSPLPAPMASALTVTSKRRLALTVASDCSEVRSSSPTSSAFCHVSSDRGTSCSRE